MLSLCHNDNNFNAKIRHPNARVNNMSHLKMKKNLGLIDRFIVITVGTHQQFHRDGKRRPKSTVRYIRSKQLF